MSPWLFTSRVSLEIEPATATATISPPVRASRLMESNPLPLVLILPS